MYLIEEPDKNHDSERIGLEQIVVAVMFIYISSIDYTWAPKETIVENHLNIALLNVF